MENKGENPLKKYKRRRTLSQTQREEENENAKKICDGATHSLEGDSFPDASEIEIPTLDCTIGIDKLPGMKLTLKYSLGEFQTLMFEALEDHQRVLTSFRENTPFGRFLDVDCIPPPLFMWQLIGREAKFKRQGEMWFVVKGVPVRYSLMEFSLISGLNCSQLNAGFENSKELTAAKNDFIRARFPSAKKGKKTAGVTYKMVVQRFKDICKDLDGDKNEGQEMEAVKMATLLFVVVVLLAPADRGGTTIPDWILGMIGQWTTVARFPWGTWAFMESLASLKKDLVSKAKLVENGHSPTLYYTGFLLPLGILFLESCVGIGNNFTTRMQQTSPPRPRICLWGDIPMKKKISHNQMDGYVGDLQVVQSILVPDSFEATSEWVLNIHPLEIPAHPELDAFVEKLRGRCDVHIPVRVIKNPSPTRVYSVEGNEEQNFSSPQSSQSLGNSPSRASHDPIPSPTSPAPSPPKPSSSSFKNLFEKLSKGIDKKLDDVAEQLKEKIQVGLDEIAGELKKRLEVVEQKVDRLETLIHQNTVNKVNGPESAKEPMKSPMEVNVPECADEAMKNPLEDESTHDKRDGEAVEDLIQKKVESTNETNGVDIPVDAAKIEEALLQEKVVSPLKTVGTDVDVPTTEYAEETSHREATSTSEVLQIAREINQFNESPPKEVDSSQRVMGEDEDEEAITLIPRKGDRKRKPTVVTQPPWTKEGKNTKKSMAVARRLQKDLPSKAELENENQLSTLSDSVLSLENKGDELFLSPYIPGLRRKDKVDVLLINPPSKGDLWEFKTFIDGAIKADRYVECHLQKHKENEGWLKKWWTDLITPGLWVADEHLTEYLYILRRRLCNDDGDSVIAPFEFGMYLNFYVSSQDYPLLEGNEGTDKLQKILDGTYYEGSKEFKNKAWDENTKYVYYLRGTGSHWFCVKADFEKGCLVVFYSMQSISTFESMHEVLRDDLKGFPGIAGCRNIGKFGYIEKWSLEIAPVPQQENCDCGIFAVKMLELAAQHRDFQTLENMTTEKMRMMRLEIAYYICKEYHCRDKK